MDAARFLRPPEVTLTRSIKTPPETHKLGIRAARATWIRALKQECPLPAPVKVVWSDPSSASFPDDAYASVDRVDGRSGPYFYIQVDRTIHRGLQAHFLVHEWAHALVWDSVSPEDEHGQTWGAAYARCYQAVIEK